MCLNFIPERGNTWLYASGKAEIGEPCLRIGYINSISLRLSLYPRMIRDILHWICQVGREVDSESLGQLTVNYSSLMIQ